ncbi:MULTISPECIES: amine dehydrogenase large subunit [unclassified Novosphingobium]|uniref:amine dehydrogenase large subunit n=1 Tax=unclassified Novosphingobium TaxID=2644732 RepID=UPI00146E5F49|nr:MULTISPECIES: amine dehydrogenase large subunit [unclassified Novosphingobium]NMN06217.1 methylamine dehydrogenase heavy chain [Novosphingobium sp. SG919]NMN88514.1 methylamine dehydrogenase heavy chain [Novosphingobium sp. SG916]
MTFAAIKGRFFASATLTLALGGAMAPAMAAPVASVEPEQSDVAQLTPPKASWFFINRGFTENSSAIYDTTTGKLLGHVETPQLTDLALDPAGKFYYVSSTLWTKASRGTRQDYVSVFDSVDLKLQTDIPIPGRLLVGGRLNNFVVSPDGKFGYVYNMSPASSVNVVDLAARKFVKSVELPGCASLVSVPGVGISALCSDGSLATLSLAGAKSAITRSEPFFSATDDPIFDNFQVDRTKNQIVMLSYTGKIYTATLGAKPVISAPFSLQEAAGVPAGSSAPNLVNWYPGGVQQMALHVPTGQLYVLMHMGEFWSHKAGASEVWQLDLATRKVVKRMAVPGEPRMIAVTQEATPHLVFAGEDETVYVYDLATGKQAWKLDQAGNGVITVAQSQ